VREALGLSHEEVYTILVALESQGAVHIHHATVESARIWMPQ
jgi:hypothetical protein